MPTNIPVVPIALGALARALATAAARGSRRIKTIIRARRHRRDAVRLISMDHHMLRDIGLTEADVRDAFASRFWEDPTELLSERLNERRGNRVRNVAVLKWQGGAQERCPDQFKRPRTDRPARQAM
ncbi:MAG TPA: hypothetical protein VFS63_04360 [Pseudolabrys sp.]|jgi:uncharacterized protein YjiS (DUF1127 family)|nr:hypothetical protein [Pseudolabrys sp.]